MSNRYTLFVFIVLNIYMYSSKRKQQRFEMQLRFIDIYHSFKFVVSMARVSVKFFNYFILIKTKLKILRSAMFKFLASAIYSINRINVLL